MTIIENQPLLKTPKK